MFIKRNEKHFNEQAFFFFTDNANSNVQYTTEILDVERALKRFTNSLNTIIDKHAPFKKLR